MKRALQSLEGSVTAPRGFLASGVFCNIKRRGTGKGSDKGRKPDLALIVSEVPATVAGLFTTNQVCAAPVKLCVLRVAEGQAQAIVANSGNANACTGRQGLKDAREMAACAARHLHLPADQVLVASTGRIGVPLPMEEVRDGIRRAAGRLGHDAEHGAEAAEAILTSDTRSKQIAVECRMGSAVVRLGGIAKGAGMIQPGMSTTGQRPPAGLHATMLCFLTTDAQLAARPLQACLERAVAQSFNRITVDGDMSTNDTVLLLANGLAGNAAAGRPKGGGTEAFQEALDHVCLALARMMVRDGEGVTRLVTIRLSGARTGAEAEAAALAVANSALVKTSWCGGDPNWGRIMAALGYSSATVLEGKVDLGYSAPGSRQVLWSLRRGQPTRATFPDLCAAVAGKEFDLHIRLNLGAGSAIRYAADLTEAYVDFNKGDVSDPTSLGG